jgi:CheY-like chemotaxis protein
MDCQMPELDGFDACRQIRTKESELGMSHTWIIAMTASVLPSDREHCLAVGMDGYVSKPVVGDELLTALVKASEELKRS